MNVNRNITIQKFRMIEKLFFLMSILRIPEFSLLCFGKGKLYQHHRHHRHYHHHHRHHHHHHHHHQHDFKIYCLLTSRPSAQQHIMVIIFCSHTLRILYKIAAAKFFPYFQASGKKLNFSRRLHKRSRNSPKRKKWAEAVP